MINNQLPGSGLVVAFSKKDATGKAKSKLLPDHHCPQLALPRFPSSFVAVVYRRTGPQFCRKPRGRVAAPILKGKSIVVAEQLIVLL